MTRDQALTAILEGVACAQAVKICGYDILGVGEMGIGNTTTSSCVLAALTKSKASDVVGRGGGLGDEGLAKKIKVVRKAAAECEGDDVIDILAKVGGFDICAMTGAFLGAAYYRLPVVVDGYISCVAALSAAKLAPNAVNFMFGSHLSKEQGYKIAAEAIGLDPYFDLGMRLGEGSGCPISFNIIETACAAMSGMATFEEGSIDADYLAEARERKFLLMNILISGGCKNGKSYYAQKLALSMAQERKLLLPLYYLATMIPVDDEDRVRIERHLKEREGWGFDTIELGLDICGCLKGRTVSGVAVHPEGVFLLDSVTALLSNEMFRPDGKVDLEAPERVASDLSEFALRTGNTVFVSDYIYSDAFSYESLTEEYRRGLARADRRLARDADGY